MPKITVYVLGAAMVAPTRKELAQGVLFFTPWSGKASSDTRIGMSASGNAASSVTAAVNSFTGDIHIHSGEIEVAILSLVPEPV